MSSNNITLAQVRLNTSSIFPNFAVTGTLVGIGQLIQGRNTIFIKFIVADENSILSATAFNETAQAFQQSFKIGDTVKLLNPTIVTPRFELYGLANEAELIVPTITNVLATGTDENPKRTLFRHVEFTSMQVINSTDIRNCNINGNVSMVEKKGNRLQIGLISKHDGVPLIIWTTNYVELPEFNIGDEVTVLGAEVYKFNGAIQVAPKSSSLLMISKKSPIESMEVEKKKKNKTSSNK